MFFIDLKFPKCHTSSTLMGKEMANEFWEDDFYPTHGFFARLRISSMCRVLSRQLQDQKLLMMGSISLHGLGEAHLSRKSERYRSLSSIGPTQSLSYGHSWQSLVQYTGPSQSFARHPQDRPVYRRYSQHKALPGCMEAYFSPEQ